MRGDVDFAVMMPKDDFTRLVDARAEGHERASVAAETRTMDLERAIERVRQEVLREHPEGGSPVAKMLALHLRKPWIPGFRAVLIRPLREGLDEFLGPVARSFPGRPGERREWHVPSAEFWLAHAQTSHPPNGLGCDSEEHIEFLASDAPDPEFGYAELLDDDTLVVEDAAGFRAECRWWTANVL